MTTGEDYTTAEQLIVDEERMSLLNKLATDKRKKAIG